MKFEDHIKLLFKNGVLDGVRHNHSPVVTHEKTKTIYQNGHNW